MGTNSRSSSSSIRSEEHTSELQSLTNLGCRLLLEKKRQSRGADRSLKTAEGGPSGGSKRRQAGIPASGLPCVGPERDDPDLEAGACGFFLMIRGPRSSPFFPPTPRSR